MYILLDDAASVGGSIFSAMAENLAKSNLLTGPTKILAKDMVNACTGLAATFFLIMLALNIFKISIGQSKDGFHFMWRLAALIVFLTCYTTLMPVVDYLVNIPIVKMKAVAAILTNNGKTEIKLTANAVKAREDAAYAKSVKYKLVQNVDGTMSSVDVKHDDPADDISNMTETQIDAAPEKKADSSLSALNPANWPALMLPNLIEQIYGLVLLVVVLIQTYAISILYITGPIAITFSMLTGFESGVAGWIKYYIVIKLWIIIVYVIQALSASIIVANIDPNTGLLSSEAMAMQVGLIVMYTMIPKFADILISGSQGGAFFSAAVAGASMAAGKAMGVLKGTGKATAGGVLDVAGIGKGNDIHTSAGKAISHIAKAFGGKKSK